MVRKSLKSAKSAEEAPHEKAPPLTLAKEVKRRRRGGTFSGTSSSWRNKAYYAAF